MDGIVNIRSGLSKLFGVIFRLLMISWSSWKVLGYPMMSADTSLLFWPLSLLILFDGDCMTTALFGKSKMDEEWWLLILGKSLESDPVIE